LWLNLERTELDKITFLHKENFFEHGQANIMYGCKSKMQIHEHTWNIPLPLYGSDSYLK
jgi:hypothetical protein